MQTIADWEEGRMKAGEKPRMMMLLDLLPFEPVKVG